MIFSTCMMVACRGPKIKVWLCWGLYRPTKRQSLGLLSKLPPQTLTEERPLGRIFILLISNSVIPRDSMLAGVAWPSAPYAGVYACPPALCV